MQTYRPISCLVLALVAACGGGQSSPAATTSSLSGALAMSTFPAAPTAIEAVDELGKATRSAVDGSGRFSLSLEKSHVYRLAVVLPSGSEPLVFPRASKRLDTTVRISTAAASVSLGTIRHFASAPGGGFTVRTQGGATPEGEGARECENGLVTGTAVPCVDDDGKANCDQGVDDHADGECENGKDSKTGASCVDAPDPTDDASSDADPGKPMAVPDHDAPDDVAGCKEGGAGEDPAD